MIYKIAMEDNMIENILNFQFPDAIYILCIMYAIHMVEEFTCGFVGWANVYLGKFNWIQNIIGNSIFMIALIWSCYMYCLDPVKNLWLGMCGAWWVLSNAFIHISATIMGRQYSPGVVTATIIYVPLGIYFFIRWAEMGVLTIANVALSFVVGGCLFMLIPTFGRSIIFKAKYAALFHLVK